jgi:predicted Zn-dependent protease
MLGRLLGVQNVDKTALLNLQKVGDLQRQGKYAEALKVLQTLPPAISDSRIMLSVQASLAMLSKQDSEYARVLAKLAAKYSDDPAAAFKLVDHYFTTKDLPNMLRSLDTMEKRVGVDGVTRHLRAAAYCSTNDYTSCLRYADESCKLEPDRMAGYDVRATALVGLGRFPDAVAQYRDMEKGYGLQFTRAIFEEDPAFAKFVASPAFNGWLPK